MEPRPVPEAFRNEGRVVTIGPPPAISRDDCGDAEALLTNTSVGGVEVGCFRVYFQPTLQEIHMLEAGCLVEITMSSPRLPMHAVRIVES